MLDIPVTAVQEVRASQERSHWFTLGTPPSKRFNSFALPYSFTRRGVCMRSDLNSMSVTFRLPERLASVAAEKAARERINLSALMRRAVERELEASL